MFFKTYDQIYGGWGQNLPPFLPTANPIGCLSSTPFAIFINDSADEIKASKIGLTLDPLTFINILFYADDIVLLAKDEGDLQSLLTIVETWCQNWRLEVNLTKTNFFHVRKSRKSQCSCSSLTNDLSLTAPIISIWAAQSMKTLVTKSQLRFWLTL